MRKTEPQQSTFASASYSLIAPSAISEVIRQSFGLVASAPLRLLQRGLKDHYALPTSQGTLVIRVYRHGWRSDSDVQWELEFLNHLHSFGAPIAPAVPCVDGHWFTKLHAIEGVRQVAVFRLAPGSYTHFGATGRNRISPSTCVASACDLHIRSGVIDYTGA